MGRWRDAGGIFALLDLIEEHRGAVEYDWRARFHLGLHVVPEEMSWGEAYRLAVTLTHDPSSMLAAALADLSHPVSREWLVMADLFDLIGEAAPFKKAPKYPRPTPEPERQTSTYGDAGGRSAAEVMEILRDAAHTAFETETPEEAADG